MMKRFLGIFLPSGFRLVLVCIVIVLTSCDRNKFFNEFKHLENDKWPKDQVLSFKVNIEDTISTYRFFLNVRNNTSYQYNNICFFLTTEFPGGGMSRDTIECLLAAKDGTWLGKGSGRYRDNRIPIRGNIRFPRVGTYILSLNQAMREDVLLGISEAGVRLEKEKLKTN
jgi:gliding motility-associated lipoprotein GldH